MRRPLLTLLAAALLMLALASAGLAHQGHPVGNSQTLMIGPFQVTVEHNPWPIKAQTNVDLVILLENAPPGTKGMARVVPPEGSTIIARNAPLSSHPSLLGAWTVYNYVLAASGDWYLELELDGPLGKAKGRTATIPVSGPPGLPLWLGWVMACIPALGFGWFLLRERRRLAAAVRADAGARL